MCELALNHMSNVNTLNLRMKTLGFLEGNLGLKPSP